MVQTRSGADASMLASTASRSAKSITVLLDLPLEILRQILEEALVVDEIEVSDWGVADTCNEFHASDPCNWVNSRCLYGANVSLLMVSKHISSEAAKVFYGRNTFAFHGAHQYREEVQWLRAIGPRNRGYITNLSISIRTPSWVWQLPDGTREGGEDAFMTFNTYNARHPLLQKPRGTWSETESDDWQDGWVHDIDPDLEATFSLLGRVQGSNPSSVRVILHHCDDYGSLLGVEVDPEEDYMTPYYPTDLPNLVEAWRTIYSTKRSIDVVWRDYHSKECTDAIQERYKGAGWTVVACVERRGGKRVYVDLKRDTYQRGPIIADQPFIALSRDGHPAVYLAEQKRYGLWSCEEYSVHRDGDECTCASTGQIIPTSSMAQHDPKWPKMPET